jgi:hypothetical protein
MNLKEMILSLDISNNLKAMLLNRATKLQGSKIVIDGDSVEIVNRTYSEHNKGLNGRYYITKVVNTKWLDLDYDYNTPIIIK